MNYYVKIRGRILGPYDLQQLQQLIQKGKVGRHNEISEDGHTWFFGQDRPEFFPARTSPNASRQKSLDVNEELHMVADPSDVQWYYSNDGITGVGPFSTKSMIEMFQRNKITKNCLAWKEGGKACPLGEIPELVSPDAEKIPEARMISGESAQKACDHCGQSLTENDLFCPKCGRRQKKGSGRPSPPSTASSADAPRLSHSPAQICCKGCNQRIAATLIVCPFCGTQQKKVVPKNRLTYLLLGLLLLGALGIHNFYADRKSSAIAQLLLGLTIVGLPISYLWAIVDVFRIHHDGRGVPFFESE